MVNKLETIPNNQLAAELIATMLRCVEMERQLQAEEAARAATKNKAATKKKAAQA